MNKLEERELAIYSGNIIRKLRNSMGLTQKELGKKVGVSNSAIANYEKGFRAPLQDTLFKLAETFNVSVNKFFPYDFESSSNDSPLLSQITDTAAKLHEPRQKKVLTFTQDQLDEQEGRVEEKILSYYTLICNGAVSAGTGEWLEDEYKEEITISADKVPSSPYDLVLRVNGDSMEPLFQNHEYIFVRNTTEIRNGQIGVFIVDNEAYLKKAYVEKDHLRLVSLNKAYDDLVFDDKNEIKAVGVVVM